MKFRQIGALALGICLGACVTVNVYFPESAAERAADRFIKDVYGQDAQGTAAPADDAPQGALDSVLPGVAAMASRVFAFVLPPAYAQPLDINIATPAISALKSAMEQRHRQLKPHYDSGAVGMASTGLIVLRDPKLVPLQERNQIKKLVVDENADRTRLYAEIARANAHPEWEPEIRETFAQRWVANAPGGWWYQSGGAWLQK